MVDEVRVPGRFVLTGSQQFGLLAGITQSLAGRVGIAHLLPLSIAELSAPPLPRPELDQLLLTGGYPAIHAHGIPPGDWLAAYVATYLERDVRQLVNIQDLSAFQRFLRLCALHPLRGALFETLIVSEVLKHRRNAGVPPDFYFWRDNNGLEADLLLENATGLQPVAIKSGRTVTADYIRAAQKAGRIPGDVGLMPWLVHGGEDSYERSGVRVVGWRSLGDALSGV